MTENDKNLLEKSVHFEQAPVDVMFAVNIWISEIGRNTSVVGYHIKMGKFSEKSILR